MPVMTVQAVQAPSVSRRRAAPRHQPWGVWKVKKPSMSDAPAGLGGNRGPKSVTKATSMPAARLRCSSSSPEIRSVPW